MTNHMQVCSPLRLLNEAQIASKAALEKLSVLYSSIVDHLEVGLRRIHDAQDDLPTPEDIEREVSRSRHLLGGFDGKIDQSRKQRYLTTGVCLYLVYNNMWNRVG